MLLKDAIRYYELTGFDFQTDLQVYAKVQRMFLQECPPDNFTEQIEGFTDKLLILWTDRQGGIKNVLERGLELPTQGELISEYCRVITPSEVAEIEQEVTTLEDDMLRKHKKDKTENKTLDLIASITNAELNVNNFLDMELELIYQMLEIVGERKKKEADKAKKRSRKV